MPTALSRARNVESAQDAVLVSGVIYKAVILWERCTGKCKVLHAHACVFKSAADLK